MSRQIQRIYLDASVILVLLFGKEREPERHETVSRLFYVIDSGALAAVISIYTLQEVVVFCRDRLAVPEPAQVAALALRELLRHAVRVVPLLSRIERIRYARAFPTRDTSDLPHLIVAHLHHCDAIIAYDEHYRETTKLLPYLQPQELLALI